jgi:putative membrane protein
MKKLSFLCVMAAGMLAIQSCGDNNNKESVGAASDTTNTVTHDATSPDTMNHAPSTAATTSSSLTDDENKFVINAASGGMMEVQLGKLAQEKSSNIKVKDFASKIVTDHTKANDELKALAQSKGITLTETLKDEHQKHITDLNEKTGADFDKAYMKLMVEDHKDDIDNFQKCSKDSKDADVKAFATKTIPVLQKHLADAKIVRDAVK